MMLTIIDFLKNNTTMIKVLTIVLLVAFLVALIVIALKKEKQVSKSERTRRIAAISILSALSFVLYMVKFNLPFLFPEFLEIQFSNVPALIGGFLYGPIAGTIILIVRMALKMPLTSTAGVGEVADLIIGLAVVLVSSLIYQRNKTRQSAVKALVASTFTWIIIALVANWLVLIPFYVLFYFGGNIEILINSLSVIPGVNESNYMLKYLLYGNVPFNLLLSVMVNTVTFLVYKRVSFLVHSPESEEKTINNTVEIAHK